MNATAYLYSNSIKTSCPSRLPNNTFVTGSTVTRGFVVGPCAAGAASASAWCYEPEFLSARGAEDSACVAGARGFGFLGFQRYLFWDFFKTAPKAGKSNSHSPNPPKVLKIPTLNSPQIIQHPPSYLDNQGLPTWIYSTGARRKLGTYVSTALQIDLDTHNQGQQQRPKLIYNNRIREVI